MDPKTGKFVRVASDEEAIARGLIPCTQEEVAMLSKLSESERKEWAAAKLDEYQRKQAAQAKPLYAMNRRQRRAAEAKERQSMRRSSRMAKRLGVAP